MNDLKLTSSSHLLPKNRNWYNLSKKYNLRFGEYGNWFEDISKDSSEVLSITIFLEDFIDNKNLNIKNIKKKLLTFFQVLNGRLKQQNNQIIVSFFSNNDESSLSLAKNSSLKDKISVWFKDYSYSLIKKHNNLFYIDLIKEFSNIGISKCIDFRNWYYAHTYLSSEAIKILSNSIEKICSRIFQAPSKVLVLDCDNTLWGGIIGEDGLEKIQIGQDGVGKIFEDFQKEIKNLIKKGVIVALLSKNNEKDVWQVFKQNSSMILKKKDIVAWKINWNEKYKNIYELSRDLDLDLKSFVFWDDNPIERDQMKKFAPKVFTIDVPDAIYLWPNYLKNFDKLIKFNITNEDKKKTFQYSARAKFIREKDVSKDKKNYLKSIKLRAKKLQINKTNINRAEQMNLKTNQYNLRTKRYILKDIRQFNNNNKFSFLGSLKDTYGDHGIVGSVYLEKIDHKIIFLDNLLMSCRVICRYYESWLLNEAIKQCKKKFKYIVGQYIPTQKNIVVKNFFQDHNFKLLKKKDYDVDYKKIYKKYGHQNLYIAELNQIKIKNAEIYK